jgi:hypothetical protein
MLEAERAGAKALVLYLEDWPRRGEEWKLLRRVHEDEAHNCALIGELLKKRGAAYSHATGEFYGKAAAVGGRRERLEFLARGLRWAVARFDEALPRLDAESRAVIHAMRERHLRSVSACESLTRSLPNS